MNDFIKTLLITPPCIDLYNVLRPIAPKSPPLGLAYIAAVLLENDISVEIFDTFALDLSWKKIIQKIKSSDAVLFGATCLTSTLREVIFLSKIIKKYHPNSLFIVGGSHPTADYYNMLKKHQFIDIVVIREGEYSTLDIVKLIQTEYQCKKSFKNQNVQFFQKLNEIKGIAYRNFDGKIYTTLERQFIINLDELPYPAYELLPNHRYRPPSKFPMIKPYSAIITVRGCPYNCSFCAAEVICGKKLRQRSVENIQGELKLLKEKYNVRNLWINDSTFTIKEKRALRIAKSLKDLDFKWACNTRADFVNEISLKYLALCGCNLIEYGFESGDDEVLKTLKKGLKTSQIENAVKWSKSAGSLISGAFIIGIPGDNVWSIKKTLKFARKLNLDSFSLSILTPYPGTEFYDIAKEKGYLKVEFEDFTSPKHTDPIMELQTISSKELSRLWIYGNLRFYFRINYFVSLFKNVVKEPRYILSILYNIQGFINIILNQIRKIFKLK